jgi:hypothetical protein
MPFATTLAFCRPAKSLLWAIPLLIIGATQAGAQTHSLTVLPPEHKTMTDPATGATLTFLTTSPETDLNLYFHEYSWTRDGAFILFTSSRPNGGLMAYLTATGELVTFQDTVGGLGGPTAAVTGSGLYALRGRQVVRVDLAAEVSTDLAANPSKVTATEKVIAELPEYGRGTGLSENCAGTTLSIGVEGGPMGPVPAILTIDVASGEVKELCRLPQWPSVVQHVQWSHTDPFMLSFAGSKPRLMVVDTRDGNPRSPYPEWAEELVTHESWWVNDQIIFCGGTTLKPTAVSHVKLLDMKTGTVRVIGAGAWWEGGTAEEISRYNWWHADGSDDGRWVVADNWHGDIMLFEGKTTRPRLLTGNHRTYGKGNHPHVGFDRAGKSVIFTSHLLGDENVCVATIPEGWQRENPS